MTYQRLTIGSYTFSGVRMINPEFLAAASVGKLLGTNRSVMTTWGTYGSVPWYFEGILTGLSGKTDLWSIISELESKHDVHLKGDMLNGIDAYGRVISVKPTESHGFTEDDVTYNYPVTLTFVSQHWGDEAERGIMYGAVQEADTFGITGVTVIGGATNATGLSETVDYDRTAIFSYTSGTASATGSYWMPSGTCTIPCAMSPTLSTSKLTYRLASEADLGKAQVNLSRSGAAWVVDNGFVRAATSHASGANQGYIEVSAASGAAWCKMGDLRFFLENTGGTLQEASALVPDVWPLFAGDPERQSLRLKYPPTTSGVDEASVDLEVERCRPWVKSTIYNADATTKDKCFYQFDLATGYAYFWCTGAGTAVDASGAAIGTPASGAGTADTINLSWIQSTVATGVGTMIVGFARKKLADTYHFAYDSGYSYSYLGEQFDNVSITKQYAFEPVWLLAYKCDQLGNWPAPSGASEALNRVTSYQTVIPRM